MSKAIKSILAATALSASLGGSQYGSDYMGLLNWNGPRGTAIYLPNRHKFKKYRGVKHGQKNRR